MTVLESMAEITIERSPEAILEWISDLDRYKAADTKVVKVLHQGDGRVRYRGRIRGVPTVAVENIVELDPGRALVFRGAPDHWTRHLLDFEASFVCTRVDGGTHVVHREAYGLKPAPIRILVEWWVRDWLQRDIEEEVVRLKRFVEAAPAT